MAYCQDNSSSSEDDLALTVAATVICAVVAEGSGVKRKRSIWCRRSLLKRPELGACTAVTEILRPEPSAYKCFLRMDEGTFAELLDRVSPYIRKQDTVMRESISPQERLVVTLRYLASGMCYQDLESYHKISRSTLSSIIPETCKAIYDDLKDDFLKMPATEQEWQVVADGFTERWDFPHCIGAMDGKHIRLKKPAGSGSDFFNYKKFYSIVLLSIVDADYKFLFVDVGSNGRVPDSAIFQNCGLSNALENNSFNLPPDQVETGFAEAMPYVFVGDDAFPLKRYLMKPYPQRDLTLKKRVFNYRLSRARRISENAFGILANRFRIFHNPIALSPDRADDVVLATVSLHNFLRSRSDEAYVPAGFADNETPVQHNIVEGTWRQDADARFEGIVHQGGNHNAVAPMTVRDQFADYFCSEDGEVTWQWRKAVLGDG